MSERQPAEANQALAAFMVTFESDPKGSFWALYQGTALIGRKDAAEGLQVPIDHPTTSSRHAQLILWSRPGRARLEDLGSTNGTYVNDQRLEPHQPRELRSGDSLRFGGFTVTIHLV